MSSLPERSPKSQQPLHQNQGTDESGTNSSTPEQGTHPVYPLADSGASVSAVPPALYHPPRRPLAESAPDEDDVQIVSQHPIPPPSEPMQYRAIGLVRGRYTPLDAQLNRGTLLTSEGTSLDAVLLGRVISLVKNHLDLEQEYLWVVYPRTRENQRSLHLQILGVWEPEELSRNQPASVTDSMAISKTPATATDGYFSIRGEVVYQSPDQNYVVVKIQQSPRKRSEPPKSFKLRLEGDVFAKAVGYFWELDVQRQASALVIDQGRSVAIIPPRKTKRANQPGGPANQQKRFVKPVRIKDARLPTPEQGVHRVERPIKPKRPLDT